MSNKTFWFINDYAGSKYHGMEFRHYYIARELIKLGHIVHIISASYSHLFKNLPEITGEYTHEEIDGIKYLWIRTPNYKESTNKLRILKWFIFVKKLYSMPDQLLSKPDYIINSPAAPFTIITAKFYAKKYDAKLIFEVKDIWPLSLMELGGHSRWHPLIILMQWFENYAYKKADMVTSTLSNALEHMAQHGLDPKKFQYIPNGVSLEEMGKIEPLDKATEALIPHDKFIVGYVGTMGFANHLEVLVDVAEILQHQENIAIVLTGDGKDKDRLYKRKIGRNLTNLVFIGPIEKNQVQSILKKADVCYIGGQDKDIYKFGVSPNKLYDYMFAAKPVLYSHTDPIIERCGYGRFANSQNPQEVADSIIRLYEMNEEQRVEMGALGKEQVLEHHTYDQISKKLLNACNEL